MTTPREKGDALEKAVAAIERHILETSPSLKERTFLMECKKVIQSGGVHHEIDIFVTIELAEGYKSFFIFECKNWEASVGKNEIIVLSEKIDATQAQIGFFVAKTFTRDAEFQAEKNPRIRLIRVSEREAESAPLPFGFHNLILSPIRAEATFHKPGGGSQFKVFDVEAAVVKLQGQLINLRNYLISWAQEAAQQDALTFPSHRHPDGEYERIPTQEESSPKVSC